MAVAGWDRVRVGDTVEYTKDKIKGYVGEIKGERIYVWQDIKCGAVGDIDQKTKGFKYSWLVGRTWSGEIKILHGAEKTNDIEKDKERGGVMEKYISKVFEKTEDALLVEKHMNKSDNFITELIYKQHSEAILEEAKRLEAEEKKEKE